MRLAPEEAARFMAPRCRHGFRLDHTGPPTALGPMRPLPIAWIMFENVCSWPRAEEPGTAAMPSGYSVTFPVAADPRACVLLTRTDVARLGTLRYSNCFSGGVARAPAAARRRTTTRRRARSRKEGLPDGVDPDQLMRELEDFLRKQCESGGWGAAPLTT